MEITYTKCGDYYIPDLVLPKEEQQPTEQHETEQPEPDQPEAHTSMMDAFRKEAEQ